jgi:hypothetical protein
VVLGGNPLIDGGAEKAPGVADFEGGNLFRFDRPVDADLVIAQVFLALTRFGPLYSPFRVRYQVRKGSAQVLNAESTTFG